MLRRELIRPLPELLKAHAARRGTQTAFADSRRGVSYAQLEARTRRLAGHLAQLRLLPGDRAAIYLGNCVETIESYLAIARASAIGVPINPHSSTAELAYLLDDSAARVIVTDHTRLPQVRRLQAERPHLTVVVTGDEESGAVPFDALAGTEPQQPARDDLGLDDIAWMLYTSGTTGRPKGVLSTQRSCLWSVAASSAGVLGLSETDRVLWPVPLFHSLAHIYCVLSVTAVGATARITEAFDAEELLHTLRAEEFTFLAGVPTMYHYLLDAARDGDLSLPNLRVCLSAGAISTATLRAEFQETFGVPLLDCYGSTETCGLITANWPNGTQVEGSCGLPVPGLTVRIVDPETHESVETGEEGEIWVGGPSLMVGYYNQPEATEAALPRGWYRTGDLGRRDDLGYHTITGRLSELIIRSGENIHPTEVEQVLLRVPGVADAAVVGSAHPALGEVPVAFLVPAADGFDPDEVFAACREHLAYFKVPEELYEIGSIPRTGSGKIKRHVLAQSPARLRAVSCGSFESLFRVEWTSPAPVAEAGPVDGDQATSAHRAGGNVATADPEAPGSAVVDCPSGSLDEVLRAVRTGLTDRSGRVAVLTHGMSHDPAQAAVWGLVESMRADAPHDTPVLVDADGGEATAALSAVLASGQPRALVRGGEVLVPRLARAGSGQRVSRPDPDGTVLVSGADQEQAAELAGHLVAAYGIRHVRLLARTAVPDLVARLTELGASVTQTVRAPGDRASLAEAFQTAGPPVTAVLQVAGPETLPTTLTGEVELGPLQDAPALDELTREAPPALFVLSAPIDNGPAHAVFQSVANRRHAAGLPALALGWGPHEELTSRERLALFDAATTVDDASVLAIRHELAASAVDTGAAGRLARLPAAERGRALLDLVLSEVGVITGRRPVHDRQSFRDIGMTSTSAVELRGRLAAATGLALPATLAFDYPNPDALAAYLGGRLFGDTSASGDTEPADPAAPSGEPIAIVGMACRLPGGVTSPEELWELLSSGGDGISGFPTDRGWDLEHLYHPDPDHPGTSYVREGGFLHNAGDFDAALFGISPREALTMDPQQRLLLETTWEVLERAGIDPTSLRGSRTGVFAGVMYHDYISRLRTVPPELEGYLSSGGSGSVVSGRVSYTFGFEGPAVSVDTACSSSLVALHLAVQALRAGECTLAVAGGVTVMASPSSYIEFSRQRGLSPDGRCKSFAATADGAAWSEGAATLLVERLSDAQRLGHPVLAVVRGTAVNQDGASNGLTAPNGPSQQRVIRDALTNAQLTTADIDLIEAHGTGTKLGDPIEAQAVLATYGQNRDRPVWLGSLKSNIGHTQAAAGAAGVMKAVLSMRHGVMPKSLRIDEPSPEVDWSAGAVEVLSEARDWPGADERPRRAGVSSFGVSGTNAHVILEQAPPAPEPTESAEPVEPSEAAEPSGPVGLELEPSGPVPWVLSTQNEAALKDLARQLATVDGSVRDIAHSLINTRAALPHRAVVVGSTREEFATALEQITGHTFDGGKTVLVFPGQGSQWVGMGQRLWETSALYRDTIHEIDTALSEYIDWSVTDILTGQPGAPTWDRVDVIQPVLFTVMTALATLWQHHGLTPDAIIGHSQGEIAAAYTAGALTLQDAARITTLRSKALLPLTGHGTMISVLAPPEKIQEIANPDHWNTRIWIAAHNAPNTTTITGDTQAITHLTQQLSRHRIMRWQLPGVDFAGHSGHINQLHQELQEILAPITPQKPTTPFYSTTDNTWITDTTLDADYWYRNLRQPVLFQPAINHLTNNGYTTFIETSPHPTLTPSIQETNPNTTTIHTLHNNQNDTHAFLTALGHAHTHGHPITWHTLIPPTKTTPLPTYPFQHTRYWLNDKTADADVESAGLSRTDHPLLGATTTLAHSGETVLTGRLSPTQHGWLADHAVNGTPLLPGTALVDMALHAGDHTNHTTLDELIIHTPTTLTHPTTIQLTTTPTHDNNTLNLTIHTRTTPEQPWTQHATGTLTRANTTPPTPQTTWPPTNAQPIDLTGTYQRLATTGLEYGPTFQGLHALWRRDSDNRLLADVRLPDSIDNTDGYGIHPALLDAALHALVAVSDGDEIRLPFAWTGVTLHATGATKLRVELDIDDDGTLSLSATDTSGQPVVTVDSLTTRPIDPAQLRARPRQTDDLYALDWLPWSGNVSPTSEFERYAVPTVGDDVLADTHRITTETLTRVQQHLAQDTTTPLVVEAAHDDLAGAAVWGLIRTAQTEHPNRIILIDTDNHPTSRDALASVVASGEPQARIHEGAITLPRLTTTAITDALTPPADTDTWHLHTSERGTLENLTLTGSDTATRRLLPGEVRVAVRAAGLNFRDVLIALGMYPGEATMGSEAAGIVLDIGPDITDLTPGDRVTGLFPNALANVAVADRRTITPIPAGWSYTDAAAFPIVYLTAYYALHDLAALKPGERVLIHAGTGGVGTAAIQLAQHLGAEVFATANPTKWPHLRAMGLDDHHIATSRTPDFETTFHTTTQGQGIHVILNSLTDNLTDASLRLLTPNGRFIEMGKTDVRDAEDLPEGITYQAFDLALDAGADRIAGMLAELVELFDSGALSLPPVRCWDVRESVDAFRFMAQARHIGKVVLTIPHTPDGTILITGGTGNLGSLIAHHLVTEHGARDLVLTSRQGPNAPGATELTNQLQQHGARIRVRSCDLTDRTALATLIDDIGPLTGVIHTAGALSDTTIDHLNADALATTLTPKANAAWWLHELTQDHDLALFVVFSSSAAVLGSPGQANYAAANSFLDALITHRRRQGLPGTSLAWGWWQRTGAMTAHLTQADHDRMTRAGLYGITEAEGTALFDTALGRGLGAVAPVKLHLPTIARSGSVPPVLRALVRATRPTASQAAVQDGTWADRVAAVAPEERRAVVLELVRAQAATVLGHSGAEHVSPTQAFKDSGFDSLTAVEFRNRVTTATGLRLPATLIFDHPTPNTLADHLLTQLAPADTGPSLADLDGIEVTLRALAEDGERRSAVVARLKQWLSTLGAAQPAADTALDLDAASAREIFDFLDGKAG